MIITYLKGVMATRLGREKDKKILLKFVHLFRTQINEKRNKIFTKLFHKSIEIINY